MYVIEKCECKLLKKKKTKNLLNFTSYYYTSFVVTKKKKKAIRVAYFWVNFFFLIFLSNKFTFRVSLNDRMDMNSSHVDGTQLRLSQWEFFILSMNIRVFSVVLTDSELRLNEGGGGANPFWDGVESVSLWIVNVDGCRYIFVHLCIYTLIFIHVNKWRTQIIFFF